MAKSSKSPLPVNRQQFRTQAKPVAVVINGKELVAAVKEFSTGSLGWNINDKMQIDVGGHLVTVQVGLNLTIIGSKELPQDQPPPGAAAPESEPAPASESGGSSTAGGQADF